MESLLLRLTAVAEGATGVALLLAPNFPSQILFGLPLGSAPGEVIGRILGAALIAIAVACWRASEDTQSRTALGVLAAILVYDVIAAALLAYARFGLALSGPALWLTLGAHVVLALWCIGCLARKSR